jgi:hypothetical protein
VFLEDTKLSRKGEEERRKHRDKCEEGEGD